MTDDYLTASSVCQSVFHLLYKPEIKIKTDLMGFAFITDSDGADLWSTARLSVGPVAVPLVAVWRSW